MNPNSGAARRRGWAIALGAVTLCALGFVMGILTMAAFSRRRVTLMPPSGLGLSAVLGVGSVTWYAAVLTIPFWWWLARRLPVEAGKWKRSVAVHALAIASVVLGTSALVYVWVGASAPFLSGQALTFFSFRLLTESLPLVALVATLHALNFRRRADRQATRAAQLSAQLADARLDTLTHRLRPHFLFNTLQSVSTLLHRDPVAADRVLALLSDLLRDVLKDREGHLVPLGEELDLLERYVAIHEVRFPGRLSFEMDVPDALHGVLVPYLILQPLVENAIEHGLADRGGGRVRVHGRRGTGRIELVVSDDGAGWHGESGAGIGLRTTRERLLALYGESARLRVDTDEPSTTRVVVELPE